MNKYPERIMQKIRCSLDLEPNDTSRDREINEYTPSEALKKVCQWEGLIGGYSSLIVSWVEDCYGIKIKENKL